MTENPKKQPMIILVWNETQTKPATTYGKTHYGEGNFQVRVVNDPIAERKKIGGDKSLIYHFK